MRTDYHDVIDERIDRKIKPPEEATILSVSGRFARVRTKGSYQTKWVECNDTGGIEPGKNCVIQWIPSRGKYIIIAISTGDTASNSAQKGKFELYPPDNLATSDVLPDSVILTWNAPAQQTVTFEVEQNTSAIESGATSVALTRGSFVVIHTATTKYFRVRSVSDDWRYSGWSDWIEGVPGDPLSNVFQPLDSDLTALASATATGFVERVGDGLYEYHPQANSYGAPVGTFRRSWFDTATVTHEELSEVVGAVVTDLQTMHILGIIPLPDTPTITSPTEGQYTDDDTFAITWSAVAGDNVTYNVEVYSDIGLTTLEDSSYDVVGTSYTTASLPDDIYYIIVWAESDGGLSPNSAVRTFHILQLPDTPTLVSPADDAYLDESAFTPTEDATDLGGTSFTASDEYPGYGAGNAFNNTTAGNEWASLNATMPHWLKVEFTSPQTIAGWNINAVGNGLDFILQYWDGAAWQDATALISDALPNFTWVDGTTDALFTSDEWRFYFPSSNDGNAGIYEAELLLAPDGTLIWNAATRAEDYDVQITLSSDPTFASPLVNTNVTGTGYLPSTLSSVNHYLWRVRAHNGTGYSSWSTTRDLYVQNIPVAPTLAFPDDNRWIQDFRLEVLGFNWNDVATADNYWIQVTDTSGDYSSPIVDDNTVATSDYVPGAGVIPALATPYYWRVAAENETGWGAWSTEFEVMVTDPLWEYIAAITSHRVSWWAKDADTLLMRATNPYVAEGRDLVLTGDFAADVNWVKSANWTIVGGVAHSDGTGTSGTISQTIAVLVPGKAYKVVYTVSNYVSGTVRVQVGTTGSGADRTANGTYTDYIICTSTTFRFQANTAFVGDIDNVTLKQVNIRASTDYPSATGRLNVAVNGGMAFDYAWSGTNWAYNGTDGFTHTSGATNTLAEATSVVIGKSYDVTFTITGCTAGGVTARVGSTGSGTSRTANGTYTETIVAAGSGTQINFAPTTLFDGTIKLVSCVPTDSLLVFNGDGSTTTGWTLQNSATLSSTGGRLRVTCTGVANAAALQVNVIVGRRYRIRAKVYGDGSANPVVILGGVTIFTGTTSTSQQDVDVTHIPATANLLLRCNSSTNTQFCEFDDISIVEINPLDGLISGAALTGSMPAALGAYSLTFDGVNDFVNIYSAELNSLIDPAEYSLSAFFEADSAMLTDAAQHTVVRLSVDANNDDRLRKTPVNNTLNVYHVGAATTNQISSTQTSVDPAFMEMSVDVGGSNQDGWYNATDMGNTASPGTFTGNLSTTGQAIGAAASTGTTPWDGEIYAVTYIADSLTDAVRLGLAQLAEVI